jgi:hypothetical protein
MYSAQKSIFGHQCKEMAKRNKLLAVSKKNTEIFSIKTKKLSSANLLT